jgi:hypothetical protein
MDYYSQPSFWYVACDDVVNGDGASRQKKSTRHLEDLERILGLRSGKIIALLKEVLSYSIT